MDKTFVYHFCYESGHHQNTTQVRNFCNRRKSFWCMVQPLENMVVMQYIRHQRMYLYSPENTTQNFSQDDQKSKIIELPSNVTFWDAHVIFWRSFFSGELTFPCCRITYKFVLKEHFSLNQCNLQLRDCCVRWGRIKLLSLKNSYLGFIWLLLIVHFSRT